MKEWEWDRSFSGLNFYKIKGWFDALQSGKCKSLKLILKDTNAFSAADQYIIEEEIRWTDGTHRPVVGWRIKGNSHYATCEFWTNNFNQLITVLFALSRECYWQSDVPVNKMINHLGPLVIKAEGKDIEDY